MNEEGIRKLKNKLELLEHDEKYHRTGHLAAWSALVKLRKRLRGEGGGVSFHEIQEIVYAALKEDEDKSFEWSNERINIKRKQRSRKGAK